MQVQYRFYLSLTISPNSTMKTTIESNPASLTNTVNSVRTLNVNGGNFAEISYGITGEMSVLIEGDTVQSLFASADAELVRATQSMKRATIMRNAAWKLIADRA